MFWLVEVTYSLAEVICLLDSTRLVPYRNGINMQNTHTTHRDK